MKRLLYPDYDLKTVHDITDEIFGKYRYAVFDLDNTVAPYGQAVPNESNLAFFEHLRSMGIDFAFISNNNGDRLETFCAGHDWIYIPDARKPSPSGVKKCLAKWGAKPEEVLMVGDQLLTDCAAAHRAGVDFCLVEPIKDRTDLFFRLKRAIEKPILKRYRRKVK